MKNRFITGVLGLPIRSDGKFLLTRRYAPGYKTQHNKWQIAGGTMEFGETPQQTLSRELFEELRVSVRIIFPYPIAKTYVWCKEQTELDYDAHVILLAYLVDVSNQTIKLNQEATKFI